MVESRGRDGNQISNEAMEFRRAELTDEKFRRVSKHDGPELDAVYPFLVLFILDGKGGVEDVRGLR